MPSAADLFADRDLAAVASCLRVDPRAYPDGLLAAAESLPPGPWFYTGALENRPGLLAHLARSRPLWGNGAETVRAVRDPIALANALHSAGFPAPDVRLDPIGLRRDGSWLRKPINSAGGAGIERLGTVHDTENSAPSRSCYYQERIYGASLSAVFVGSRAGSVFAGVTRQLIGRRGARFAYRGNVTPWPVAPATGRRIEALGRVLGSRFGLVGLFGVDFVLDRAGEPWTVEVNPRYTASVEVLELSLGRSLLTAHQRACEGEPLVGSWPPSPLRSVAKEILFAGRAFDFDDRGHDLVWDRDDLFRVPRAADLPFPGTTIERGAPVLTIFGQGKTPSDALSHLARERDVWRSRFPPG